MAQASRDQNFVPTLLAVSNVDGVTPVTLYADPVTHRLLVSSGGGGGSGTVTSVSVVSANGFAGTVATATTTPAITLSTSITGILKGNGTAISAVTIGAGLAYDGTTLSSTVTGDVVGPASSTDNAIVRFDGLTGKLIQNYTSGAPTISDTGAVDIPLTTGNSLVVDTNTFVVDATNNRVGVRTSTPNVELEVNGTARINNSGTGILQLGANTRIRAGDSGWTEITSSGSGTKFWNNTQSSEFLTLLNASGNFGINNTNPPARLTVRETTDAASVQVAVFEGDRATPAANDNAYISIRLSDSAGNQDEFARITATGTTVTSTTEAGSLTFGVIQSGTLTNELVLNGTALTPFASDGLALGTTTLMWADLFLASGGVLNFNNGDVTVTHGTNVLTFAGATTNGYQFQDGPIRPVANDGIALGTSTVSFADLFLATGGVINWANGNATLTHSTGLLTSNVPLSLGTSNALTAGTIELGAASDTTISRSAAGVIAVEGVVIPSISSTNTLTNKRVTPRVTAISANSATPTINTDNCDYVNLTAQTNNITSMTTNLSGTPTDGQMLRISLTAASGTPTVTWGASFEDSTVTAPTSISTTRVDVGFVWNTATSKWRCVAKA